MDSCEAISLDDHHRHCVRARNQNDCEHRAILEVVLHLRGVRDHRSPVTDSFLFTGYATQYKRAPPLWGRDLSVLGA